MTSLDHIRNFSIIAHIDHGKSTLADRILEMTGTVTARDMKEQMLDTMDLERERGITIKAQAVRIAYKAHDGQEYQLNLIDTPGHVDFTYEVSRSLAACEGAVLVVDATQGVEAQTVANAYLAMENDLEIIPVLNKVDLPAADVAEATVEVHELTGSDEGRDPGDLGQDRPGRGGRARGGGAPHAAAGGRGGRSAAGAHLRLRLRPVPRRGRLCARRGRQVHDARGGGDAGHRAGGRDRRARLLRPRPGARQGARDRRGRLHHDRRQGRRPGARGRHHRVTRRRRSAERLPGYRVVHPMVFCGLFPTEGDKYGELRDALDRLKLNDAALDYEPETSKALGFGFRCGFLGLLHMDIVRERLEREYDLELLATTPNVEYHAYLVGGSGAA